MEDPADETKRIQRTYFSDCGCFFYSPPPLQPVLGLTGSDSSSSNSDTTWEYHPDRIILTFNENVTKKEVSEILEQEDMQPILFSGVR